MRTRILLSLLLVAFGSLPARAATFEADVCVYGGTSGGVIAAVQAARMGKTVILLESGRHLGGMTSGGLSAVDIGDPRSVGGLAREYFTKLAATTGTVLAWDKPFENKSGGPATGGATPSNLTRRSGFSTKWRRKRACRFASRPASLRQKEGGPHHGTSPRQRDSVRAKVFIDTTYEGDLMAKSGVAYTVEREGNAKFGETYNGIHYAEKYQPRTGHLMPGVNGRVNGGQGVWDRDFPLDPYVKRGDPASGLLPLVDGDDPGVPGEPAPGVQAYCYRLCLTTDQGELDAD
jgi:choline dehydrogenase-like flavoprotein